jgi:hypothetical protein
MKNQYIARSTMVAARQLGGEMVVMSAMNSTLFTLNEVATAIWNAANGATPLSEIIEQSVCAAYDVVPGVAIEDAEGFVRELAGHGILLVSDEPIAREHQRLL